jgi:putative phage-type endonuclease
MSAFAPQGSAEWLAERIGKVTASRMADLMARTKTGYGASRANYMAELVAERLTGNAAERFQNDAMRWGNEQEASARDLYAFMRDAAVDPAGFVPHPLIADTGASPDGYVGEHGLVEIKCPNTATHIDTLLSESVADKYVKQMHWQMICTGRKWCDFVSFDPRMPASMQLFVRRVSLSDELAAEMEDEVRKFLDELDEKVSALQSRYGEPTPTLRDQLERSAAA